jgi:predicted AAA+ superfamily ATPase
MKNAIHIERNVHFLNDASNEPPPVLVITGPRATGKTHLAQTSFPAHRHTTLALPSEATAAQHDPAAFLAAHPPPVVIDDVHLAPRLLHHLGRLIAERACPAAGYVLVGSRPILLAAAADEAFAGRARVVHVPGLSHAEVAAARPDMPIAERLLHGGYPAAYATAAADVPEFMRALVADHLVRELPVQLRVDSLHDFERFLRAAALRTGRLLNKSELAREVGIAGSTAAIWLDTLVEAGIVDLLWPWKPPQAKPLVKAPKLYFRDTGLAAHLLGIRSAAELAASPHAPALWETAVHGEIRRLAAAATPAVEPVFWRDRTKEADFLLATPRGLVVLDAAWAEFPTTADVRRLLRIRDAIGAADVATLAVVGRTPTRQALREPSGPAVETIGLDDLALL